MAVWILFSTFLVLMPEYSCQQRVTFFRCNNDTKVLEFLFSERTIPDLYDIYAVSKRSTCGLRASAFTGTGVYADPYVLSIDLSSGLRNQDPDCGVTQGADGVLGLTVAAQQECEGTSPADIRYQSSCSMVIPGSEVVTPDDRLASFTCISPSTIVFNYREQDPAQSPPFDVYAMNRKASCSISSGRGSGTGTIADPFNMRIDVSTMATQCGVQMQRPDVYSMLIYVQKYRSILTSEDLLYRVTCDFVASATIGIETVVIPADNNPPTVTPKPNQPTASLSVVTTSGDALTSLTVGDSIRLVAQLIDGPAVGLRVTSCQASPGRGQQPIISILDNNGCSVAPVSVPPFIGQTPTGSVAMTNEFKAFKFDQSDTVYFSCQTRPCYDSDLSCLGIHCTRNRRRKREATKDVQSREVGILIFVKEPGDGNSSNLNKPYHDNHTSVDDITTSGRWPLTALVTTSSLAAVSVTLVLVTVGLLTRLKRRGQPQGQVLPNGILPNEKNSMTS